MGGWECAPPTGLTLTAVEQPSSAVTVDEGCETYLSNKRWTVTAQWKITHTFKRSIT